MGSLNGYFLLSCLIQLSTSVPQLQCLSLKGVTQFFILVHLSLDSLTFLHQLTFQLFDPSLKDSDSVRVLLFGIGNQQAVVCFFLLDLLLELRLQLEDDLVSLLLALKIALGVLTQLSGIVFLFSLFRPSLILKRGPQNLNLFPKVLLLQLQILYHAHQRSVAVLRGR